MTSKKLSERMLADACDTDKRVDLLDYVEPVRALEARFEAAEWRVRETIRTYSDPVLAEENQSLRAENTRLREALHPGGRPHDVVRGKDGTWEHPDPCDDGGACRWCWEADRFERLTGLDAVTGEKR